MSNISPSKPAPVPTPQFAASKQMPDCIRPTYFVNWVQVE